MKHDTEPTSEYRVDDRRHWMRGEDSDASVEPDRPPGAVDDLRRRAEEAEAKLQDYIAAFKQHEREQEEFRVRIAADVERRAEGKFASILEELLETVDHLDLAIEHADADADARALIDGVAMARDGFLAALARHGVQRICPNGEPFDPNVAEAIRLDPVGEPELDGTVSVTLRPGYRLGDRTIRAARVAVGRYDPESTPESADR